MAGATTRQTSRQARPRGRQPAVARLRQHSNVRYEPGAGGDSEISCCVKYSVFGFNVVFFIFGFVLLLIGVWAQLDKIDDVYAQLTRASKIYLDPTLILIIVGIITFLIGFSGCVGALRENTNFLTIYSALLGLLLVAEAAGAIFVFAYKDQVNDIARNILNDVVVGYRDDPDLQTLIDTLQCKWSCCGVNSPDDWEMNEYFAMSSKGLASPEAGGVPFSCCVNSFSNGLQNLYCGHGARSGDPNRPKAIYLEGCLPKLLQKVENNIFYIGVTVVIVAVVQMLGICFAQNLKSDILAQRAKWLYQH